jgi:microcompartment protein CcmK/EutM
MNLGTVTGTLVASRKEPMLDGLPLLVVRRLDERGEAAGGYVIAVDAVGAGVGEVVLYASGSSARQTAVTRDKPCDAVIMAIVDQWDVDGETVFVK